jgi:hypothetical protein
MNGRYYVDIITINGIDIYAVVVDPNGVLQAPIGSIATLKTSPRIWVNADGLTTWNQVFPASTPGGELSQEVWIDSNALPGGIGSAIAPFQTIQDAISNAALSPYTRWKINVIPGNYPGAVSFPEGFHWTILGAGLSETTIATNIGWAAVDGDSLTIIGCVVGGITFSDGSVPPTNVSFYAQDVTIGSIATALGIGVFNVYLSADIRRETVSGNLQTSGFLVSDGPCVYSGTISCSEIFAAGGFFDNDITLTGTIAQLNDCKFTGPAVLTTTAGTATIDPITAQNFIDAGGTLVATTLSLENLRGGFSVLGSGVTTTVQGSLSIGEQLFLVGVNSPAAIAGANNDYGALPNTASVARVSASAPGASITGLTGGASGRVAIVINVGTVDSIEIVHDSVGSIAANRILLAGSANLNLAPNSSLILWWDTASSRWRNIGVANPSTGGSGGGAVLGWGNGNVASTTTTRFLTPWYEDSLAPIAPTQWRAPRAGTLENLRVRHNVAAGNGNNIVYTVRINGVATLLSVSLASTANDGSDLVNTVAVAAGDLIDVQVTKALSVATSPTNIEAVMEFS